MNAITAGQTLTARSACDSECIFSVEVVARTAKTARVIVRGEESRCKIHTSPDGREYIMALGTYSMAPAFYAN